MDNKFKYDIQTIEWNIRYSNECIDLRKIVRFQKLTPYVCAKYVVFGGRNEMWATCREDAWISSSEIPRYQPHITIEEMRAAHKIANEEDDREEELERKKIKQKIKINDLVS